MHCTGVQDAFRGFVVPPWDAWRTRLVRARVLPVDGVAKCLSRLERWSRSRGDGDVISPVRGFLPRRAGRCLAVNVPKPAIATGSPRARASPMAVVMAPITRSAADLGKDACPATSAASSVRFQARVVRHLYAVLRRRHRGDLARRDRAHLHRPERAYMDILQNVTRTLLRSHIWRWMTMFPGANTKLANLVTRGPLCAPWPCRRFRVRWGVSKSVGCRLVRAGEPAQYSGHGACESRPGSRLPSLLEPHPTLFGTP